MCQAIFLQRIQCIEKSRMRQPIINTESVLQTKVDVYQHTSKRFIRMS